MSKMAGIQQKCLDVHTGYVGWTSPRAVYMLVKYCFRLFVCDIFFPPSSFVLTVIEVGEECVRVVTTGVGGCLTSRGI